MTDYYGLDYLGSPTMGQPGATGQYDIRRRADYGSRFSPDQQQPIPLFAPNQTVAQSQAPSAPQTIPQQSYTFGPESQGSEGLDSASFASSLGQSVLGASQKGAASGGFVGRKKQDPYAAINLGGGWNVGGLSGVDYT